jgi:hypothetical protein
MKIYCIYIPKTIIHGLMTLYSFVLVNINVVFTNMKSEYPHCTKQGLFRTWIVNNGFKVSKSLTSIQFILLLKNILARFDNKVFRQIVWILWLIKLYSYHCWFLYCYESQSVAKLHKDPSKYSLFYST